MDDSESTPKLHDSPNLVFAQISRTDVASAMVHVHASRLRTFPQYIAHVRAIARDIARAGLVLSSCLGAGAGTGDIVRIGLATL